MPAFDDISYDIYLEKSVVILLRSKRYIYGILKSYDQYNTIVINFGVERIFFEKEYAEKSYGLIVLRPDKIVFIALVSECDFKNLNMISFTDLETKFLASQII